MNAVSLTTTDLRLIVSGHVGLLCSSLFDFLGGLFECRSSSPASRCLFDAEEIALLSDAGHRHPVSAGHSRAMPSASTWHIAIGLSGRLPRLVELPVGDRLPKVPDVLVTPSPRHWLRPLRARRWLIVANPVKQMRRCGRRSRPVLMERISATPWQVHRFVDQAGSWVVRPPA